MYHTPPPTIKLVLGDTLAQMQARSSYRLLTRTPLDDDMLATNGQAIFSYMGATREFTLPPARLSMVSALGGVIYSVKIWPHLEFLSADGALRLLQELISLFDRCSWNRSDSSDIEWADLEDKVRNLRPDQDLALRVATWHFKNEELTLELRKQPITERSRIGREQYLISVGLFDGALYRQQDRVVHEKRAADRVNPSIPRPLP